MVKKAVVFYSILIVFLIITLVIPFNYGLLIWFALSLTENSLIIQKAISQKPPQKKALLIVSSIFILLPIIYALFLIVILGGIEC